jgi:endoglucanase
VIAVIFEHGKNQFKFAPRAAAMIVALAVMLNIAILPATAEPRDFIHAQGRHLVDGRGDRFDVRGINLGNWLVPEGYMFKFKYALAPKEIAAVIAALIGAEAASRFWTQFRDVYITEDDIRFIKAAGFNTVRVPLNWRLFVKPADNGGADGFDGEGWRLLDRLVQWCRDAGVRVIVDLHAAPGGQTGVNHDDGSGFPLTFYLPRDRRVTVALWRALAAHFRDEPAILGYDLLNEPISAYSDETYLDPQLEPLYRDITTAIRSVDPNHVVLLEGAEWASNFGVFGAPFDANAVYSYHEFWSDPSRKAIQAYLNFSNRWNVPVLIGETGEYNDAWNEKFRSLHEQLGIGWIFWPYKSLASITSPVSIEVPAGWDLILEAERSIIEATSPQGLPSRDEAQTILDAYLDAAKFQNVRVNGDYLKSLGLAAP